MKRTVLLPCLISLAVTAGCARFELDDRAGLVPQAKYDEALAEAKRSAQAAENWRMKYQQLDSDMKKLCRQLKREEENKLGAVPALQAANETLKKRNQGLRTRLAAEQAANAGLRGRLAAAAGQGGAPASQPANAAAAKRARITVAQAKLRRLKDDLRRLEAATPTTVPADKAAAPSTRPTKPVTGTIIRALGMRVVADVGTKHGLVKGMRLFVYRGGRFVGFLHIESVEATTSRGPIVEEQLAPSVGDKVTTAWR